MSEWTEFVGYDEDGTPIFVTVKGVPEANQKKLLLLRANQQRKVWQASLSHIF